MSASATSVAHPSVPLLSGPVWASPRPLWVQDICVFNPPNWISHPFWNQTRCTLPVRATESSTSWRKIVSILSPSLKTRVTFYSFPSIHHNHELCPVSLALNQSLWLFCIYFKSSTLWFSRINPQGLNGSNATYSICFHAARHRPAELPHRVAVSWFNHISGLNLGSPGERRQLATACASPGFSSAFKTHRTVCVAGSLHSMTPKSQLLSPIPALLYLYQRKPHSTRDTYQTPLICVSLRKR